MTAVPLFDDIERTDASPSLHSENDYAFLNRVAGPFWDRTRSTVEEWFRRLPSEAQADIRGRLRSGDDRQFTAAFWEMYVHESLFREGFELVPHPEVPGTSSRPDFAARRQDAAFYVEATVTGASASEAAAERRRNVVYDSLNNIDSPNFFLGLAVEQEAPASPSARRLRGDLQRWLATLDPDAVARVMADRGFEALPRYEWNAEGWTVTFTAIPKTGEARGRPGVRPIGMFGPGRASYVNDVGQLRSDLKEKAGKYGQPDLPFVIAVSVESGFFDNDTADSALFGREAVQFDANTLEARPFRQPDGFWRGAGGPRNTRVSAVVVVRNVRPWHFTDRQPVAWHNPWASLPLPDVLPWESRNVDLQTGTLVSREPVRLAHEVLGLPEGWPGPEDPF